MRDIIRYADIAIMTDVVERPCRMMLDAWMTQVVFKKWGSCASLRLTHSHTE